MCLLAFILVTDTTAVKAQQTRGEYKLVFSDEFNLPNGSQPDALKWSRAKRYSSGWNRWISDAEEVVFIKNGKLICRAIPNTSIPADTAKMLTGAIETIGKFDFLYGKVEVRLKTNALRGNFPAVWMKPSEGNVGRDYGEIDIFEACGDMGLAQQTVHSKLTLQKRQNYSFRKSISMNKWHIYGVEWTPTQLTFYIDGVSVGSYEKSRNQSDLANGQWTFDRPFYLIVNQSVGDGATESMQPQLSRRYETQVDWVRVYQLEK